MSVKSKCIAESTTALNAIPEGSRVPRCEPSQSLPLLNEFARERRSAPPPPGWPRWPRNGARSDSHESVLAGGRPVSGGGGRSPLEPSSASAVVAGGLTASRISVHPELLPERASASPPEPEVPGSNPSPPDDPPLLRRLDLLLDLLPDLERTSDPALCDPACVDPLPPPSPIAARLSWLELRGCCGRRNAPVRANVGDTGGDPAW
mmetsp:Transcript_12238/g.55271  ORF Transcript_12238/g.55271 Transcript_12238/m.55271 type:complete len:206 (-) Transcript_12238:221-838(-)